MTSYSVQLPHDPASAGRARQLVARCAEALGQAEHAELAQLLVTELVANSVKHAAPPLVIDCEATDHGLKITVHDGSFERPVRRDPHMTDESGRGIQLVEAVADQWGVDDHPDGTKSVWVTVGTGTASGT